MKKIITTLLICFATFGATAQKIYDFAGNNGLGAGYSGDGGLAVAAKMWAPWGMTFDAAGNLYIGDSENGCVRMVNTSGVITTIAGTGTPGYSGDGGLATSAQLGSNITALVFDGAGNLYIADAINNVVRVVNTAGIISTYAGSGGTVNLPLATVTGLAYSGNTANFGANGGLLISTAGGTNDSKIYTVLLVNNFLSTSWGGATTNNLGDGGNVNAAGFNTPRGMTFDASGNNLYIADAGNNRIRVVNMSNSNPSTWIINNYAGNSGGSSGFSGDNGAATSAKLSYPNAVCFDASGNMYITDYGNNRVRKVSSTGTITTVAGTASSGYNGDAITATTAELNSPSGVICDASSNLYIADLNNQEVRKISSTCIPPTIISQPRDTTVCPGGMAQFVTSYVNCSPGIQWQVNKGSGFVNLNNSPITFNNTSVDTLENVSLPMNGYQYQCVVKGCSNTTSSTVTLTLSHPNITLNTPSICLGSASSATLTATGASSGTYTWSTGDNTDFIIETPTITTTYTVSGTDNSTTCTGIATGTIVVLQAPVPPICMLSSDSTSQYNIITWDKTPYVNNVDSFIIYREVTTNVYKRIGSQPYSALSQFTDMSQSVGPANGNPNIGTYRYKLQTLDTCGNYSALGPYHNTVYFIDNHTGSFTWNLYSVENMTVTPVTQFNLLRDSANIGDYHIIGTVTGSQTTLNDPTYATYQNIANWRVEALGFTCNPTFRQGNNSSQSAIVKSKSNITNNRTAGIHSVGYANAVSVYPNPSNGTVNIQTALFQNSVVEIYNLVGQKVAAQNLQSNVTQINISNLSNGVYEIRVLNNANAIIYQNKIVKQD